MKVLHFVLRFLFVSIRHSFNCVIFLQSHIEPATNINTDNRNNQILNLSTHSAEQECQPSSNNKTQWLYAGQRSTKRTLRYLLL